MKKSLPYLCAATFLLAVSLASADVAVQYVISAPTGASRSADPQAATSKASYITSASPMTAVSQGTALSGVVAAGLMGFEANYAFVGTGLGNMRSGFIETYFSFTLSVENGYAADFSNLVFDYKTPSISSGEHTFYWDVRSSYKGDNYQTSLGKFESTESMPNNAGLLPANIVLSGLAGVTGNIEFRVYVYGSVAAANSISSSARMGNITLNGTGAKVP